MNRIIISFWPAELNSPQQFNNHLILFIDPSYLNASLSFILYICCSFHRENTNRLTRVFFVSPRAQHTFCLCFHEKRVQCVAWGLNPFFPQPIKVNEEPEWKVGTIMRKPRRERENWARACAICLLVLSKTLARNVHIVGTLTLLLPCSGFARGMYIKKKTAEWCLDRKEKKIRVIIGYGRLFGLSQIS